MPELRQNLATKEWIIIAAERARRPEDFAHARPSTRALPDVDAKCPFCPGHEAMTPTTILALPNASGDAQQWAVRVVPNKYPALLPADHQNCLACSQRVGPYLRRDGVGRHEIVVETPWHNRDLPRLSLTQMTWIMQAYCQRYIALCADPATELVLIFRNHGVNAGTSLQHPHSQIVASSVVPFPVRNRLYEGQRHFDFYGRCVYCDMINYELSDGSRVVMDNEHFIALVPYAASVPYEIWLLPKHHRATFGSVEADELPDLAHVLQNLLVRLWRLLDDPDYNYVIDTAPEHMADVPFYHWHLRILPRITTTAGFEIGSGIGINVVLPEEAAAQLRRTDGTPLTPEELPPT
ncbi:MAG TPA: galactose-1-phosphate uridylyltransferase [Armatimonadota bacterium]|jgi:UDPglucose--hexose-1-phosphate uridylyltransferase